MGDIEKTSRIRITTPADHRAVLLQVMIGLLEGRVSVPMANAVSDISAEVHKSIRQEWDMRCYAADNLVLDKAQIIRLIEPTDENEDEDDA